MNNNFDLAFLDPWWRFGAALMVGALIGVEREFVHQRRNVQTFAGIRTFMLVCLLGAIAAFLADSRGLLLFLVTNLGMIAIVLASYIGSLYRRTGEGATTEVTALIAYLLGALMIWGEAELAIGLGIVTAVLLSLKPGLHRLVERMSAEDLRISLQFAIIAGVILPLLPNQSYGPFDAVNPFEVWLLVVFVSAIGFAGYILMNVLGPGKGIGITGILGGLVSSTATTVSFATRSRETPELAEPYAMAILLASSVMFPRVLVLVGVVFPDLLFVLWPPVIIMLVVNLVIVYFVWRRFGKREQEHGALRVSNPLRLTTAISFGLVFALVLIVVKFANQFVGAAGVYVASAFAGLVELNAITLSMAELSEDGDVGLQVAATAIIIAMLVNTGSKALTVVVAGSPALRRMTLVSFGITIVVGIAATVLTLGWL